MKYLKRFNEATAPDKYLTSNIVKEVREIEVPDGMRVKMPIKESNDLYRVTGVCPFSISIYTIDRTKNGLYFSYKDVEEYLREVNKVIGDRYILGNCTVKTTHNYFTSKSFENLKDVDRMCHLEIHYSCSYKDFKNNIGDIKPNSNKEHDYIDGGDWENIFIDIYDLKLGVTCKYSKGAYQFTISKTYKYGEEVKDIDESLKFYVSDVVYKLMAIYNLNFEYVSINASPIKRMSLDEWEDSNLNEILLKNQIVIRLMFTSN